MNSNYKCCRGFQEVNFLKKQRHQLKSFAVHHSSVAFLQMTSTMRMETMQAVVEQEEFQIIGSLHVDCFNTEVQHLSDFEPCNPGNLTSSRSFFLYSSQFLLYMIFIWVKDSLTSSSPASLLLPFLISLHLVANTVLNGSNDHNHLWSYGIIISSLSMMLAEPSFVFL